MPAEPFHVIASMIRRHTRGGRTIPQLRLRRVCADIAKHNPAFRGLRFTPHDFRRIFTTELVNSGPPIHIGAALLGHLNIQTTRGYVARGHLPGRGDRGVPGVHRPPPGHPTQSGVSNPDR